MPAFTTFFPLRHTHFPSQIRLSNVIHIHHSSTSASRMSLTRRAALNLLAKVALYDRFASHYDRLDGRNSLTRFLNLDSLRLDLISRAFGDVLELAVGTGLNLPLYSSSVALTAVDLSPAMLSLAASRATCAALQVADAAALPFPAASFDCVLDTFSLCTFAAPDVALREARRVLRPTATSRLLLLEHTAASFQPLRVYQDLVAPAVGALSKGCVWNQRVEHMAVEAGFRTLRRQHILSGTIVSLEMCLQDRWIYA